MNKTQKFIGLLAIIPLFMVVLAPNYIGYAEALSAEGSSDIMTSPAKKLLSNDESKIIPIIGIGIEVLDEEEDEVRTNNIKKKHASSTYSSDGPYAEVIKLLTKNQGAYEVIVRVYAVDEDLREGSLLLTSDTFKKTVIFPKINADSFATIKTKMRADDPRTITAEILKYEGMFERPICYQRDRCDF